MYHRSGAYAAISGAFCVGGGSHPASVATVRTKALLTYPFTNSTNHTTTITARLTIRRKRVVGMVGGYHRREDSEQRSTNRLL